MILGFYGGSHLSYYCKVIVHLVGRLERRKNTPWLMTQQINGHQNHINHHHNMCLGYYTFIALVLNN
jgi:hypothetical protein